MQFELVLEGKIQYAHSVTHLKVIHYIYNQTHFTFALHTLNTDAGTQICCGKMIKEV